METIDKNVKEVLKLRKPQVVAQEIQELETIRSSYRHFLASYEASLYTDNAIEVSHNLSVVNASIMALRDELLQIRGAIKSAVTPVRYTNVKHSDMEVAAIMNFNKDKRFTITE